ncbi:MAG: cell wall metabolism sensor histidine kinase WalK [Defluviitaleaceae bacterium]|nr:cell wall metabolism sensor histidine kinase WalK [Defluviitaleaceae bacterium]
MGSIKFKLIAECVAVIMIVMITSGSFMLVRVKQDEIRSARITLTEHALVINNEILQAYDSLEQMTVAYESLVLIRYGAFGIQSCILNDMGQPVAPVDFLGMRFNDKAVIAALAGDEGFTSGHKAPDLNDVEQEWICLAKPVTKNGNLFIIYTRMNAKTMNDSLAQLTWAIVMTVVLALFLTGVLWAFFANTLTKPIVALTRHAKELARGNLESKITVQSKDEIGLLAENFNRMATELHITMSDIISEKNKSEAVLHNITDGVLAYDASGVIIRANSAGFELLNEQVADIPLSEMLSLLKIEADDIGALPQDKSTESTVSIAGRFITATVTPYTNQTGNVDGYIIVLQDVTRQTKLDNMRKEFVANVSHELRTPLTSIKTYSETLLDGAVNDAEVVMKYLKVIYDESERMSLLVTDLLELSRLDTHPINTETEILDLVGLVQIAVKQNMVHAAKKQQKIFFDAPLAPYFIEADMRRINQVLTNIITNSVKYSANETEINITAEETSKYYRIFIKDQGFGIPKDDLRHIFDRFYRVDKARSRAMGGTGLGLAIAKEIMEEHGGRISVSSELGSGTTMTLRFNRYIEKSGDSEFIL